jgi:rRNA-processing protein FCF1
MKNIPFMEQLEEQGFEVLLAREVMQELKDLKLKVPHNERKAIEIAFQILDNSKTKKITLGKDKVDYGLIHKGKEGYYIATLDAAIKREIPNRVFINSARNAIDVERS